LGVPSGAQLVIIPTDDGKKHGQRAVVVDLDLIALQRRQVLDRHAVAHQV
jgi:hypothetical protein